MENPRPGKVAVVDEVRDKLRDASAAILTEYRGLTVGDLSTLRRSLRDAGGEYRIYKNTLVRFAARDLGLDSLEELLVGPTAIAFVEGDAVSVAKALRDYARTNPHLVVKGGVLGTAVLTASDAAALADIPPREVLLARFAGLLAAPMQQFAGLLQALPRNLAYGLKALIEKSGGVPEAEPEAEAVVPEAEPEAEVVAEAAPPEPVAEAEAVAPESEPAPPTPVGEEVAEAAAAESADESPSTDESQDQE
jgi:large subunit ribosomal protein L10